MITINNFAGEGLGPLTCAHLRLTDVTAADATQHKSMGWFRFPSPAGTHKDRPTVVMAKLYKASPTPNVPYPSCHWVVRKGFGYVSTKQATAQSAVCCICAAATCL